MLKPFVPFVSICVAAGCALALAACIVDLSNLSGGRPDGGAAGGGDAGGSTAATTTGGPGATTGAGGATSASTTSSATSGSGTGGMSNPCPGAVLDCSGCACPAGGCAAVPLGAGTDADGALAVTVSSEGVFWGDKSAGKIMGILAQQSAPTEITAAASPTALAVAGGRLIYTAQDGLRTCLLASCAATQKLLAAPTAPGSIQSMAYDGQLVYWTDRGSDPASGNGAIWRCDPTTDCSAPTSIAGQLLYPQGLYLTGDSLFWVVKGNGQSNGSIHKSPRTGSGQMDIAAALVLPTGIAADDTYVYWTQGTLAGAVLRCDHTQGYCMTPTNVAPKAGTLGLPIDLAITGQRIYWNENASDTISSCPLPGCAAGESPRVHASGRQGLHRIAVGSSCLFWTDSVDGGTVDKVGR